MHIRNFVVAAPAALAVLILSGCGHTRYGPAVPANAISGERHVARASFSGVVMRVDVNTWDGDPSDLEDIMTPVRIEIQNESDRPLSLRYTDFEISNPAGVRSHALPPFSIRGSVTESAPITPFYPWSGFVLYPGYGFYGPAWGFWLDNWGWDGGWYNTYWGYWQKRLPTGDMLRKAIPEGVVNAGGQVEGYLYFQKVPKGTQHLEFTARLEDARTHSQFGTIRIPFTKTS